MLQRLIRWLKNYWFCKFQIPTRYWSPWWGHDHRIG